MSSFNFKEWFVVVATGEVLGNVVAELVKSTLVGVDGRGFNKVLALGKNCACVSVLKEFFLLTFFLLTTLVSVEGTGTLINCKLLDDFGELPYRAVGLVFVNRVDMGGNGGIISDIAVAASVGVLQGDAAVTIGVGILRGESKVAIKGCRWLASLFSLASSGPCWLRSGETACDQQGFSELGSVFTVTLSSAIHSATALGL